MATTAPGIKGPFCGSMNVVKPKNSKAKGNLTFLSSQNPTGYTESERKLTVTFRFLATAVSQTAAADKLGNAVSPSCPSIPYLSCKVQLHSYFQVEMSVLWMYSKPEEWDNFQTRRHVAKLA